eukprot:356594-Chlamydomonas_euryale.AAC.11
MQASGPAVLAAPQSYSSQHVPRSVLFLQPPAPAPAAGNPHPLSATPCNPNPAHPNSTNTIRTRSDTAPASLTTTGATVLTPRAATGRGRPRADAPTRDAVLGCRRSCMLAVLGLRRASRPLLLCGIGGGSPVGGAFSAPEALESGGAGERRTGRKRRRERERGRAWFVASPAAHAWVQPLSPRLPDTRRARNVKGQITGVDPLERIVAVRLCAATAWLQLQRRSQTPCRAAGRDNRPWEPSKGEGALCDESTQTARTEHGARGGWGVPVKVHGSWQKLAIRK